MIQLIYTQTDDGYNALIRASSGDVADVATLTRTQRVWHVETNSQLYSGKQFTRIKDAKSYVERVVLEELHRVFQ